MTTVFIAFYSYKGGVGRSMALANVGWNLAARGKRVVLIDMDLEAPSLMGLVDLARASDTPESGGIVDLAEAYVRDGRLPALEGHYHEVPGISGRGGLWVMPAGRVDASYQETLARLSWGELHPTLGTQGFVDALRASLTETLRPHYVLIDSRTGFSDVGGLTTHRLADQVVLVFNLTRGCIEGTVRAYRSMTEREHPPHIVLVASPVPQVATEGTIIDRRLASARELMPLGLRYGQDVIRVDYDTRLVLGERLVVATGDDFPAAGRYRFLAETLLAANADEVIPYRERASQLQREGRVRDAIMELQGFVDAHVDEPEGQLELGRLLLASGKNEEARDAFRRAIALEDTTAQAHSGLGEALLALNDAAGAVEALRRAEALGDAGPELYNALASALQASSDLKGADAARRNAALALLAQLTSASEPAVEVPLGDLRVRFIEELTRKAPYAGFVAERFWQRLMGSLAMGGSEKRSVAQAVLNGLPAEQLRGLVRIFDEDAASLRSDLGPEVEELQFRIASSAPDTRDETLALLRGDKVDGMMLTHAATRGPGAPDLDLLRRAVSIDADRYVIRYTLANALFMPEGGEQRDRLQEALPHWQRAAELRPQSYAALYNWGWTLTKLAESADGEERARLLREACKRYESAIAARSDAHEALTNWGTALIELARNADGEARVHLLHDACDRCERAVMIKPDHHGALYNWGNAFVELAKSAEGEERARLFRVSYERYERAVIVLPNMYEALHNQGNVLSELAKDAGGEERARLLRDACKRYERAVAARPDMHEALSNWGNALVGLAMDVEGEERTRLLWEACECHKRAVTIKPDKHEALTTWGYALVGLAMNAEGEERAVLLRDACERYERAVTLDPDNIEVFRGWGNVLVELGMNADGEERARLLREACERYERAVATEPDYHDMLDRWAAALLCLAGGASDAKAARAYAAEAAEKARAASALQPTSGDYNLACALARQEEFDESLALVEQEISRDPARRSQALADADLAALWAARPEARERLAGAP